MERKPDLVKFLLSGLTPKSTPTLSVLDIGRDDLAPDEEGALRGYDFVRAEEKWKHLYDYTIPWWYERRLCSFNAVEQAWFEKRKTDFSGKACSGLWIRTTDTWLSEDSIAVRELKARPSPKLNVQQFIPTSPGAPPRLRKDDAHLVNPMPRRQYDVQIVEMLRFNQEQDLAQCVVANDEADGGARAASDESKM